MAVNLFHLPMPSRICRSVALIHVQSRCGLWVRYKANCDPESERCKVNDFEIVNRIEIARAWEQHAKRQARENVYKWLMLVAIVVIVMVVALVATNQLP